MIYKLRPRAGGHIGVIWIPKVRREGKRKRHVAGTCFPMTHDTTFLPSILYLFSSFFFPPDLDPVSLEAEYQFIIH